MLVDAHMDQSFVDTYCNVLTEKTRGLGVDIFHNFRPWDYWQIFKHMSDYDEFLEGSVVLDTGSLHTYFCLYVVDFVNKIIASDSFYWATRPYNQEQGLMTSDEWMGFVGKYGVVTETIDLEHIPYYDNFDYIFCISTIEHVMGDNKAMKEIAKALKIGGRIYLTTEFSHYMSKPYREDDGSFYRDRKSVV
jgi:SAM-dependent methyltransferase